MAQPNSHKRLLLCGKDFQGNQMDQGDNGRRQRGDVETVNGDEAQSEERLKHQERHENKLKDINTETQGEPKKNIRNSSQTNLKTANVTKKMV